jgi:CheY-like chemotaxis protein
MVPAGARVLVVDDHAPMRLVCRTALERAGLSVIEAADGAEAVAVIRAEQPDLLVLDVRLPGLSGWEVAAALSVDPSMNRIPIVFISAFGERERAIEIGGGDFLSKPFDPTALVASVMRLLVSSERESSESLLTETIVAR